MGYLCYTDVHNLEGTCLVLYIKVKQRYKYQLIDMESHNSQRDKFCSFARLIIISCQYTDGISIWTFFFKFLC